MSAGFNFSLQRVLDIRKENEQEAVRVLKQAQKEKLNLENKLQGFKDNYSKYNVINSGESVVYQKIKRNYLQTVREAISKTEVQIEVKNKDIEIKRQKAKQKQIERKTVETLKDKRYEGFIKEQYRIEQINNDEFALYGHMRRIERR